jgi:hypothetical protein
MKLSRFSLGIVMPSNPNVLALVNAIAIQEGANSYNNPGNLLPAGQPGVVGIAPNGFAVFDTLADGQAAEANQLALLANRGTCATGAPTTTLAQALSCLTPPSENDTSSYIAAVAAATGIDPNAPLSDALEGEAGVSNSSTALAEGSNADSTDSSALLALAGAGVLAWWLFFK